MFGRRVGVLSMMIFGQKPVNFTCLLKKIRFPGAPFLWLENRKAMGSWITYVSVFGSRCDQNERAFLVSVGPVVCVPAFLVWIELSQRDFLETVQNRKLSFCVQVGEASAWRHHYAASHRSNNQSYYQDSQIAPSTGGYHRQRFLNVPQNAPFPARLHWERIW